jgi:ribose/xylose/arabinose/galactoside ABC-type transport system permease subunit
MKDEKKEKLIDLLENLFDDLGYFRWFIVLMPCIIWILIIAFIDKVLFEMPFLIAKNIYNKLVDIFKR